MCIDYIQYKKSSLFIVNTNKPHYTFYIIYDVFFER